jgi:hypothetical protein
MNSTKRVTVFCPTRTHHTDKGIERIQVPLFVAHLVETLQIAAESKSPVTIEYPTEPLATRCDQSPTDTREVVVDGVELTRRNHIIVRAKRTDTGEPRCYRVEHIRAVA